MRDSQPSPPGINPPVATPPPHMRNTTPSISPLSTTSKTHVDVPATADPHQPQDENNQDNHRDDRSSSLSDPDGDIEDQKDLDSEAETERLGRTPQKPWKTTDVVRTPSNLHHTTTVLSDPQSSPIRKPDLEPQPQPQSPSPVRPPVASPASVAGRKRKRPSPAGSDADSPLSEQSESEEALPANGDKVETVEDVPESARRTPEPQEMDVDENPYISPMKAARLKRAKQKASPAPQKPAVDVDDEEIDEMPDDDAQDRENKKRAAEAFSVIAEQFQTFRAKLHAERLAAAETELEQLNLSHPTHPDYLGMLQCITARRDVKIQQEMRLHQYKLGSLRNQTLGERAQLHSQFFQEAREIRETVLQELGKQWYDIQKERRQFQVDQQDNYSYKFPSKRSDQVRQQEKYNREVSILSGMAKYTGFPAAPDVHGARASELEQDFKAMQIPRPKPHVHQHPPTHPNQNQNHAHVSGRTAEERFIEQTPWANPQHPLHQSRTPGPFGAYGMHSPAVNLLRQTSAHGPHTNSPFTTPLPNSQKRNEVHTNGLGSNDTIGIPSDPPSSVNAASQMADRFPHPTAGELSPTDQLKVRASMGNPLGNREERRNFSGLSSTSTIETPSDPIETDRLHHHYPGMGHNGVHPPLPVDNSVPQQSFVAMHTHNAKPDERKPELYENVNFRRAQMGAYGTPMPLFGSGSPARQDGQKAS